MMNWFKKIRFIESFIKQKKLKVKLEKINLKKNLANELLKEKRLRPKTEVTRWDLSIVITNLIKTINDKTKYC